MECNICNVKMNHLVDDLYFCPRCDLISSDIPPDKTIYDRSYCLKYERYAQTEIGNNIDRLRLKTVEWSEGPILDFGCGHGSFVLACRMKGLKAYGFDINPHSEYCNIANLFNGHRTVTFWDSIEHVAQPKEIIKGLNPNFIFISTPCVDDFPGPLNELTKWHHYYPGEHVHYFCEAALKELLKACGYKWTMTHWHESKYRTSGGPKNIITMGAMRI